MKDQCVLIVTFADDVHALLVQEELESRFDIRCPIFEFDRLSFDGGLSWSLEGSFPPRIRVRGGALLDLGEAGVVWWRRFSRDRFRSDETLSAVDADLVSRDSLAAMEGLFLSEVHGTFVSDPAATRVAENKLVQLRAAQNAGLTLPRTIVSQDPAVIRDFHREVGGKSIMKTLRGTLLAPLLVVDVTEDILAAEDDLRLSPAIFQERISGTRHIRANCFGDKTHAVALESSDLDWRGDLRVPMEPVVLPDEINDKLAAVLRALDLRMGIFDLKIDDNGDYVWFEVNPQGQFLFLQPIAGINLVTPFAQFLRDELVRA